MKHRLLVINIVGNVRLADGNKV